jgi:fatty acid desaturase
MPQPSELLTQTQRQRLLERSDWIAAGMVISTWLVILGLLALAGYYPSVWTVLLVWLVLPGRQLSLAVLMHEAGHGSLFRTRRLNLMVGQWLCALPTLGDLHSYARGHRAHHRLAGTSDDPDLPNYQSYPVPGTSLRRKLWRDLSGQTGIKLLAALASGSASGLSRETHGSRALLVKQLVVQAMLAGLLLAMGIGWTWFLWIFTFLTSYMWVVRLRQIGEHAVVTDLYDTDVRKNTRTVEAPWWQRFLVAPNNVNYHMEHHFMAAVPCYRLPLLRKILKERGFLDEVPRTTSYIQILRQAVAA